MIRSGGDRGASADVLRGSRGSDFESKAKVIRGRGYSVGTCFGILSCGEEGVDRREAVSTHTRRMNHLPG